MYLWTRPVAMHLAGAGRDLARTKRQLLVLRCGAKRPVVMPADRAPGAAREPGPRLAARPPPRAVRDVAALASRGVPGAPAAETVALIRGMVDDNPLWGAERFRGELLKLDIRVARSTIQRYLRQARPPRRSGQPWAAFLRNHAAAIWARDFLQVTDLLFRPLFAFFAVALATRRVVHAGATRHPTGVWVAQQLREATPFCQRPRYLIRDNDRK
jgi:hypothetical protein